MGKRGGRVKARASELTHLYGEEGRDLKMREMYDMNTGHGNGWLWGETGRKWTGEGEG